MTATYEESRARAQAVMDSLHALRGQLGDGEATRGRPDPVTQARELYIGGQIDLAAFEARLDVAFRSAAA